MPPQDEVSEKEPETESQISVPLPETTRPAPFAYRPSTPRTNRPPIEPSKAQDITASFRAAASSMFYPFFCRRELTGEALKSGQLVKDEYFTLFEAVGALEVCLSSLSM